MTPEDIKKFYADENEKTSCGKMITSPLGKYTLFISYFGTGANTWNVSRGQVYESGIDRPPVYSKTLVRKPALIETVHRNYGSFPFLFVENHPNGHDYLICGENYMGQTVIELDTGKRIDHNKNGFCWSSYSFNTSQKLLVVDGCYWAAPYEYKLFDFSDPMNGWPELIPDQSISFGSTKEPSITSDGLVTYYDVELSDDEDDDDDVRPNMPVAATMTFQRDGHKLTLKDQWTSDAEIARRIEYNYHAKLMKEEMKRFQSEDPLYLAMIEGIKDPVFTPEEYISYGVTYENWCPDWSGDEQRICKRICWKSSSQPYTIDLEWAKKTGPIKLVIYKDGKKDHEKFFMDHSEQSMNEAFEYAKTLLRGK